MRFLIQTNECVNAVQSDCPCCNLFILYILRFYAKAHCDWTKRFFHVRKLFRHSDWLRTLNGVFTLQISIENLNKYAIKVYLFNNFGSRSEDDLHNVNITHEEPVTKVDKVGNYARKDSV